MTKIFPSAACLALAGVLSLSGLVAAPAAAQRPASVFPAQKTQGGVTVQVQTARWAARGAAFPGEGPGGGSDKGLLLTYRVQGVNAGVSPRFLSPMGDLLTNLSTSTDGRADGSTAFIGGLDPRLPSVTLDFEWLDPAAPPEASGTYGETLDFKDVPVPSRPDQPVAVGRTLTTGHGTQVTLTKVALRASQAGGAAPLETLFVLHCLPPPAVPDLYPTLSFAYPGLLDDQGKNLMKNASYGSSGEDALDHTPGRITLSVASMPSPQAKTLDVKVRVQESAASLRQERWFRHLQFEVPLQTLPGRDADGPSRPVATAASGPVQSTLETVRSPSRGQYEARLWLADAYDLQDIALHDDAGNNYTAIEDSGTSLFWRANGAPVQPGKRGHLLRFYGGGLKASPSRLSLEVGALPVRRARHLFDFGDVPLPKPGETITLDRVVKDADGGRLLLRAIGYFTDQKPLPGTDAGPRSLLTPPSGLALAFRFMSASGDSATARFECRRAVSEQGRGLTGRSGLTASSGDLLQTDPTKASAPNTDTILLLPPAPGDAPGRLRVQMQVDEAAPGGPARRLVFRDLPAPTPAP